MTAYCVIKTFYSCVQDVDLKACRGTLDDCCPPPGEDQLELQEEEEKDINQVSDKKKREEGKTEEEVREDIEVITKINSSER